MKLEYHSSKLRLDRESKKNCRIVIISRLKASRLLRYLAYSLFLMQRGILLQRYPEIPQSVLPLAASWAGLSLGLTWSWFWAMMKGCKPFFFQGGKFSWTDHFSLHSRAADYWSGPAEWGCGMLQQSSVLLKSEGLYLYTCSHSYC